MKKPTGKLLFAYNTIANMESRNVELEAERDALQKREKAAADIISAVAHIGVDFGYGRFGAWGISTLLVLENGLRQEVKNDEPIPTQDDKS